MCLTLRSKNIYLNLLHTSVSSWNLWFIYPASIIQLPLPQCLCSHSAFSATTICFMFTQPGRNSWGVHVEVRAIVFLVDLRLTQFDQILVCGSWMEAADVKVGFAQLLSSTATATAAAVAIADGVGGWIVAVVVGAWRSHVMVRWGHIRLLQENRGHSKN